MKKRTYFPAGHGGAHVITVLERLRQEDLSFEASLSYRQRNLLIEMAQQTKHFVAKIDNLTLIPRAHTVEGENELL